MNKTSPSTIQVLPRTARCRLWLIGFGWVIVAALESAAYTILAQAIAGHHAAGPVLLAAAVAVLVTVLVTRAGFFSGARLAGDLYAALGQALARARLSWFTDEHRAQVALIAGRGIPGFMSIPAHQLQTLLHAPLMPLFLLAGIAWLVGPAAAGVAAGLLSLSLLMQYLAQRALAHADADRHAAEQGAAQATLELVDHLELMRTTAGPERALQRIEHRWRTQESALAVTNRAAAGATFVSTLASVLPLAGMAAWAALVGQDAPATVLALLVLVARAAAPLGELALAGLGLNDLRNTLRDYRQVSDAPALPEPAQGEATQPEGHAVALRQVGHAPALDVIDADIPVGAKVCVRGPSGSGKSTLLGLLMRFDDPQQGSILLGGVPLTRMRYADLSARIAYVPQDAVVFTGTLAENIRLGKPQASDDAVELMARQAELGSLLDRSPLGIHQPVGHQGAALSGGERQRVALARALLKEAPILVLDEATAALDQDTENKIAAVVRALPATVIFVTHRDPAIWLPTHTIELGSRTCSGNLSVQISCFQGVAT
ncbi:ABC transporter [Advenella sp. S44]|uniref:ATP-binding cassette domain-containing protein n=1 Tax=Advenella sp. S44 TaxID=1982755 RepID=UPI000C2AB1CF|nr:ABC transporter ATP-binding protein [Advenella sp. S44]PJX24118.1 ABC transporter [Advenella sp. S44]